jgi:hypothetical protein
MDLRFVVFNAIFRDVVLRQLLVNYADRRDFGQPPDEAAAGTRFIVLKWTVHDQTSASPRSQLLTAQAHVFRDGSSDHRYLDLVLQRLHAALAGCAARERISTRCLGTSPDILDSGVDTIFRTSTFEIAPASPQRTAVPPLRLAPWTCCAEWAARSVAPTGAAPSLN